MPTNILYSFLLDTYHKKRMAIFDTYEKRIIACLGMTEATEEKIVLNPETMQSVEHQEVPREDAMVKLAKGPKKRHGAKSRLQGNVESHRNRPEEIVDPRGSWMPPARRCPTTQKWHGEKGTS
jgi:hypothetical protein